jgi:molybdopterin/thiamine biosynthesis adenylyltransferase
MMRFEYEKAFSRNIGWVTEDELQILRSKKVAIAGLGGVGGAYLITLVRMGISRFHIADMDDFDLVNFNRQIGASMSTIGASKSGTLKELALDINPELEIKVFDKGVSSENVAEFFDGADIYIDSLDFFVLPIRRMVFKYCQEHQIPAVGAAPLGMGTAMLNFLPGHMSFEDYFRLEGQSEQEQYLRFLVGMSPKMLQTDYLVEPKGVDFENHKVPSTPMTIDISAGVVATQALKILLKRGHVLSAPWSMQFDAYKNKMVKIWRPFGNNHRLLRFKLMMARRVLKELQLKTQEF